MLLAPLLQDRWLVQALLQLFLLNTMLVTLWANPEWRVLRLTMLALWLIALVGAGLAWLPVEGDWQDAARMAEIVSTLPLLGLLAAGILRYAFGHRTLSSDGIFATVAVYLLIGIFFAQLYVLLAGWNPGSFNFDVTGRAPHVLQANLLYFSLVTLATVGYGDIVPVSDTARSLAVLEATVGQFYVAVIVAVFVSMYARTRHEA